MITLTSTPTTWRITLDAPPLHILDIPMLAELRESLTRVTADRHLLVIDASPGNAFSAGVSVPDHLGDHAATMLELFHDSIRLLSSLDVVTVALVQGPALGGGAELAQACDFILASDDARFGQPEIALGVFAPVASWQLSRQVAPRKGLELLLTGDTIDARTAESIGLVNAVFPTAKFETATNAWLERLTRHSASSLRLAKKAFRRASAKDLDERLGDVERLYLGELMKSEDATEGLEAFMEKRTPRWRHR